MGQAQWDVVICEDEPIMLRHVARLVEAAGPYRAVAADNGKDALAALEAEGAGILLTDIEMAGMNGLELIRQAKARRPELRTIILSGYSSFEYAQTALRYGADDYLLKPVEPDQLGEVLARVAALADGQGPPPGEEEDQPRGLAQAIAFYIQARFDQSLTVDQLAAQFNYAPSYISRVFKRAYQVSPIQYQIGLRLGRAKELLAQRPPLDIGQVAARVGYDDARYFSRVFRQALGLTPTEWQRRAHKGGRVKT